MPDNNQLTGDIREIWRQHPLKMKRMCWPNVTFYDKQVEMIHSVRDNFETLVTAGNMLGKDFVAGFIVVWYFLTHYQISKPGDPRTWVRVVTTSVAEKHLMVLWSEIAKFLSSSAIPLLYGQGGPLILLNQELRHAHEKDLKNPSNYVIGQVAEKLEKMSGHHAENTLFLVDEASGVPNAFKEHAGEWAKKMFIFGNPNVCNNFFYQGVKEGDLLLPGMKGYARKVIKIRAEDSPNVQLALEEVAKGQEPSHKLLVPGVISYSEYLHRRATWSKYKQTVGLDAEFYEGADELMFPAEWRALSARVADNIERLRRPRHAKAMGVDTAEGGDKTVWTVIDELGIIEQVSQHTPDTSVIFNMTVGSMNKYNLPANAVMFDQGGGGQEHADYLKSQGYRVRTVSFGEAVVADPVRFKKKWDKRQDERRTKFAFKNRRAQMYWALRQAIDPDALGTSGKQEIFAIPSRYAELNRQLQPIPLMYDPEGRIMMLPKRTRGARDPREENKINSLHQLIGCSPDEADSLVLALWSMYSRQARPTAGIAF